LNILSNDVHQSNCLKAKINAWLSGIMKRRLGYEKVCEL
jgi:hypothetical protein